MKVISQVLFTSEQPKKNKMVACFTSVSEKKFFERGDCTKKHKNGNKFGVTVFNDKLFNLSNLIFLHRHNIDIIIIVLYYNNREQTILYFNC